MKDDAQLLENIAKLRGFLHAQLHNLRSATLKNTDSGTGEFIAVLSSACGTGSAIHRLGDAEGINYFYTEIVMLARAFIEKVVNFCYLQVCDKADRERYMAHVFYKIYHNLDRQKSAGEKIIGVRYTGKKEFGDIPVVKDALRLFSETDQKMNWTKLSIDRRVALIGERSDIQIVIFLMNTLGIYSDASEALHGSLYGCSFHIKAYHPGYNNKPDEAMGRVLSDYRMVLMQLGLMIHEVLKLLSKSNDISEIVSVSSSNVNTAAKVLEDTISNNEGSPNHVWQAYS